MALWWCHNYNGNTVDFITILFKLGYVWFLTGVCPWGPVIIASV